MVKNVVMIVSIFLSACSNGDKPAQSNITEMDMQTKNSIYDLSIKNLEETEDINLENYRGKKLLLVNVASKCGYTYQYEGLQKLHDSLGDQVQIIGFPCNQFLFQEPGDKDKIRNFCTVNYGVEFPITQKIKVKGSGQHPIYKWLTTKRLNKKDNYQVSWNFNKFLISENGELLAHYGSKTEPMSDDIINAITKD